MTPATAPIQWATLKYNPTEAKPSKAHPDWAPQHSSVAALTDGTEQRIYFAEGPLSALRKNDQVMLEYSKGRWRLAKTQTPELTALLEQRQQAPVTPQSNVAPMPQRVGEARGRQPPTLTPETLGPIKLHIAQRAKLYAFCYQRAKAELPGEPSEAVMGAAFRLWHDAKDNFGL